MSIEIPSEKPATTRLGRPRDAIRRMVPEGIRDRIANASLPVKYEEAVLALQQCVTINEALNYNDKAEALAAWAKLYKNDEAALAARRLKLKAYRRMSEIASEINPKKPRRPLLMEGLTENQTTNIRLIGTAPPEKFKQLIDDGVGVNRAIIGLRTKDGRGFTEAYHWFYSAAHGAVTFRSKLRQKDPAEVARALEPREVRTIRPIVTELLEWLDAFDAALPKGRRDDDAR